MSIKDYEPKTKKAPWTRTPSGKRLLRSAAARSAKSAARRKAGHSSKFSAGLLYQGIPLNIPKRLDDQLRKLSRKLYESQPPTKHFSPVWRKPIRRETPAHAKARAAYNKRVRDWLQEPENNFCKCCKKRFIAGNETSFTAAIRQVTTRAIQCHHKHGHGWRGELLMFEELWIPVCQDCHAWIHSHEEEARGIDMLAPKGEWNKLPEPCGNWNEPMKRIL